MTPEEVENILLESGVNKALNGDYAFYRDIFDRVHGKPVQKTESDITSGGEKITGVAIEFIRPK